MSRTKCSTPGATGISAPGEAAAGSPCPERSPGSSLPGPRTAPSLLRAPCAATSCWAQAQVGLAPAELSVPQPGQRPTCPPIVLACSARLPPRLSYTPLSADSPWDTWKHCRLPLKHKTGSSPMGQPAPHRTGLHTPAGETQGKEGSIQQSPSPRGPPPAFTALRIPAQMTCHRGLLGKPIWALGQRRRKETRTASGPGAWVKLNCRARLSQENAPSEDVSWFCN